MVHLKIDPKNGISFISIKFPFQGALLESLSLHLNLIDFMTLWLMLNYW